LAAPVKGYLAFGASKSRNLQRACFAGTTLALIVWAIDTEWPGVRGKGTSP
jgi:hypothetical protein